MSKGIALFNHGKFFEAHEEWEAEWKHSVEPERSRLKAYIQACGVFVHVARGKWDPARRLALRALELLAEAQAHEALQPEGGIASVEIAGLEECLTEVAAHLTLGEKSEFPYAERISRLRARGKLR